MKASTIIGWLTLLQASQQISAAHIFETKTHHSWLITDPSNNNNPVLLFRIITATCKKWKITVKENSFYSWSSKNCNSGINSVPYNHIYQNLFNSERKIIEEIKSMKSNGTQSYEQGKMVKIELSNESNQNLELVQLDNFAKYQKVIPLHAKVQPKVDSPKISKTFYTYGGHLWLIKNARTKKNIVLFLAKKQNSCKAWELTIKSNDKISLKGENCKSATNKTDSIILDKLWPFYTGQFITYVSGDDKIEKISEKITKSMGKFDKFDLKIVNEMEDDIKCYWIDENGRQVEIY